MATVAKLHLELSASFQPWEIDTLLSFATGKPKEFLLTHPEYRLGLFERLRFLYARRQFGRGVPLAYITHHKEFYGLDFYVDKRVLTPRPETELMVDEILETLKNDSQPTILTELGTGSGCVAISVAKKSSHKNLTVIATDISKKALQVARRNAASHRVEIEFHEGNLLEPALPRLKQNGRLLIAANLPYGWKAWKNNGSIETKRLQFEPKIALFTGENGLALYRKLLEQIKDLNRPLTAFFEFDPRQTELLTILIKQILPAASIEIKKDLAGRDRLAIIIIR